MKSQILSLSVRELIEFVYISGNLNLSFSSGNRMLQGAEGHRNIQNKRKDNWQNEIYVRHVEQHSVESQGTIQLMIHGRIDGILKTEDITIIEEIKTFIGKVEFKTIFLNEFIDSEYWLSHYEILNAYQNSFVGISFLHWAQALIYSFIYITNNNLDEVICRVNYVKLPSPHSTKQTDVDGENTLFETVVSKVFLTTFYNYTIEKWLQHHTKFSEIKLSVKETLLNLNFPYTFRTEQRKMAVAVYKNVNNSTNLYSRAPTGTGKTLATIFPALKSMGEDKTEKIFYLTAKTIGRTVAESTIQLLQKNGANIRYCVLTAKEKICFKDFALCDPEFCEYTHDYFKKQKTAFEFALGIKIWNYENITSIARKYEICPFEFSLYLSQYAEIVVCDYNYAFDPIIYIRRHFDNLKHSYTFLIDEAHNLVDRSRDMYSREISSEILNEWIEEFPNKKLKIHSKLKDFKILLENIPPNDKGFFVLKEYPTSIISLIENIIDLILKQLEKKNKPYHKFYLTKVYFQLVFLMGAIKNITNDHVVYYQREEDTNNPSLLKIFCLNPKKIFAEYLKSAKSAVFFSATLHPFSYFCEILAEKQNDNRLSLLSPFDKEKFGLYLYTGINTLYKHRENSFQPIAELITTICNIKHGNYLVYFPSFSYLNQVYTETQNFSSLQITTQKPNMTEKQREDFLALFNDTTTGKIGFAVLGGVFGEGIDLIGSKLIGCIIVTVGLPSLGYEKDLIKNYYNMNPPLEANEIKTGDGFDYAYRFPGFNKIMQAAGRVIRHEEDKGFVVLIDQRYTNYEYKKLFPVDWWHYKIFNKLSFLVNQISDFWER